MQRDNPRIREAFLSSLETKLREISSQAQKESPSLTIIHFWQKRRFPSGVKTKSQIGTHESCRKYIFKQRGDDSDESQYGMRIKNIGWVQHQLTV